MKLFDSINFKKPRKNKFNLSHEKKLSLRMGYLYPILLQDILPGDRFNVQSEIFLRMAPLLSPIMHRVNIYTHYFFVPNRIIWNEWEEFITGGEDGLSTPIAPYMEMKQSYRTSFQKGLLGDYLGLPVMDPNATYTGNIKVSALPFRAYTEIFNEYYRDQNLTDKVNYDKGSGVISGDDLLALRGLRKRAWEKDYFTSCMPNAQKGPEVNLPVDSSFTPQYSPASAFETATSSQGNLAVDNQGFIENEGNNQQGQVKNLVNPQTVDAVGVTINELRNAVRLQEWLEKNMRGGSRYIENLLNHFGVIGDDARLQRPEYLGGGIGNIAISEVLNSTGPVSYTGGTPDEGTLPQGYMAGHGISANGRNGFKKRFKEHGHVMGIMSVLPKTAYSQGIQRKWSRFDKLDYAWPSFAHLGEQEVKNKEIYADFNDDGENNEGDFGYQSRYAEMKYEPSTIHGDMRDELNFWHMGREFESLPNLNQTFVESTPTNRIFNIDGQSNDNLYCQIFNRISAFRPLPYFGTPRL